MDIVWIKDKVKNNEYELSEHAEIERQADMIPVSDIEFALLSGEIIEEYPDDPRGESCLVFGYGKIGYPVHVVCGKTKSAKMRIITIYIPSLPKWINPRTRRR